MATKIIKICLCEYTKARVVTCFLRLFSINGLANRRSVRRLKSRPDLWLSFNFYNDQHDRHKPQNDSTEVRGSRLEDKVEHKLHHDDEDQSEYRYV